MKRAVMKPQAMNAPMLGSTMLDRKVPKRWTWTRSPLRGVTCVDIAANLRGDRTVTGVTVICECLCIAPESTRQGEETNRFKDKDHGYAVRCCRQRSPARRAR